MFRFFYMILFSLIALAGHSQIIYTQENPMVFSAENASYDSPWAGGLNSPQFSEIELDNDGKIDLFVFDRQDSKVRTFVSVDDRYEHAPEYEANFPEGLYAWVLLRDFDLDGDQDIFTSGIFGMRVFENMGNLTWNILRDPLRTFGFSSMIGLQMNSSDMPVITDLDGDLDLDILVFDFANGNTIEYHKNVSMENSGTPGLEFERITKSWGQIKDCHCSHYEFGENPCPVGERSKHVGGKSIFSLDFDGDGDHDVLIGQEDCNLLPFFRNEGTNYIADMVGFDEYMPFSGSVDFWPNFGAAYGLDSKLVVASNSSEGNQDEPILYFNNPSMTPLDPILVSQNFLRDQMIDVGADASPALIDIDADNDEDLLVANAAGAIWMYKNIGSDALPEYQFFDKNFLDLASLKLTNVSIQPINMNSDDDADIAITGYDGNKVISFYVPWENGWSLEARLPINISLSLGDKPWFRKQATTNDAFVAHPSGQLDYYTHSGSAYTRIEEGFLGFDADFNETGLSVVVIDLDKDGKSDIITTNVSGKTKVILDIFGAALPEEVILEGQISFGTGAQLFANSTGGLLVGYKTGGVSIFQNIEVAKFDRNQIELIVYPNPISNNSLNVMSDQSVQLKLISSDGKSIINNISLNAGVATKINTDKLNPGLYLILATNSGGTVSTKRVVNLR